jgi:hypothetical protein
MVTFISLLNGSSSDNEDDSASSPSKIQAPVAAYKRNYSDDKKRMREDEYGCTVPAMRQTKLRFVTPRKQGNLKTTGLYTEEEEKEMEKLKSDISFVPPQQQQSSSDGETDRNEDEDGEVVWDEKRKMPEQRPKRGEPHERSGDEERFFSNWLEQQQAMTSSTGEEQTNQEQPTSDGPNRIKLFEMTKHGKIESEFWVYPSNLKKIMKIWKSIH